MIKVTHEIILSGVGGQGLVSTGDIIGQVASIHEGKHATMTSVYGAEARGTFTKSDVILSDEPIKFPYIIAPEIILCLAQVAYNQYVERFTDDTLVFFDVDLVSPGANAKGKHMGYPFSKMSIELGNMAVANTIALGAIVKQTGMLRHDSVANGIRDQFAGKEKVIALNIKAFEMGLALS